ncbi:conjugal transfer protein TraN (plasmid) [Escherichia coli]
MPRTPRMLSGLKAARSARQLGKLTKHRMYGGWRGTGRWCDRRSVIQHVHRACWAYRDKYVTQSADNGTCQNYVDNPACTLASRQCAFYSDEGTCLHEYATYSCESKTSGKVMVCGGDVFCLDGECDKAQSGKSNDFGAAVSQLAALAAAGKDVAALNGVDVRAFTGRGEILPVRLQPATVTAVRMVAGVRMSGLAKCNSEEKALGKAKDNKLTVSVGEFCSKKGAGCLPAEKAQLLPV